MENFNWKFYFSQYADLPRPIVNCDKISLYKHYMKYGSKEGKCFFKISYNRAINIDNFDYKRYYEEYDDLKINLPYTRKAAENHFMKIGKDQKRFQNIEDYEKHIVFKKDKLRVKIPHELKILNQYKQYDILINKIFYRYLNRIPDTIGYNNYLDNLNNNTLLENIIQNIINSTEHKDIKYIQNKFGFKEKKRIKYRKF